VEVSEDIHWKQIRAFGALRSRRCQAPDGPTIPGRGCRYDEPVPTLERLDTRALREVITTFRDTVRQHAGGLNRLNVYPVPDGDTGTNMARTLDAVVAEMETASEEDLDATCDAISHGSLMGARGNSGVILSQILRGLVTTLKHGAEASGHKVAEALTAASAGAYQAVLRPIEGTILTVVRESAEGAKAASAEGASLVEVLRAARAAGKRALDSTPDLLPVLKDAGVVDAGGAGYLLLLDSALYVVDGSPLPEPDEGDGPTAEQLELVSHRHGATDGELDVSEQRYEVMYFLDLADDRIDTFKKGWGAIGDSIVVVGGDGRWNCHVHTNDVGAAIEVALDLDGRPRTIRVTDLFEEVAEEQAVREAKITSRPGGGQPAVTTAVVAVCSGDGLAELFSNLRVQGIVSGGQTLNPSTAELLDTVEHVNAEQVVILPNNRNIIPVAQQVDALTSKTVLVVPTRTMPEALAALIVYDPEAPGDENAAAMEHAIESVATGEVTQAIRDSSSEAGPISAGDWIGIVRGDGIVAVGESVEAASTALLDNLLNADHELLTIITGAGAAAATTAAIEEWVEARHPLVQVEVHAGGQPLYPYLFGVE
jgi:DAK2 domain fusion protein YloV